MEQKIQHLWSLVCERAIVDAATNNVSLTNVLEEIQVTPNPGAKLGAGIGTNDEISVPITFNLVSAFRKLVPAEYNGEVKTSIIDPNNKVINVNSHIIKIPASAKRFRGIVGFQGFKLTGPGEYKFLIEIKESTEKVFKKVGEVYLEFKIVLATSRK
jgi:hypothetical protein